MPCWALGLRDVAVEDAGGAERGGLAHGDVGVVEPLEHVLAGELEQPDGPEIEAAQGLQSKPRQGAAVQLACSAVDSIPSLGAFRDIASMSGAKTLQLIGSFSSAMLMQKSQSSDDDADRILQRPCSVESKSWQIMRDRGGLRP